MLNYQQNVSSANNGSSKVKTEYEKSSYQNSVDSKITSQMSDGSETDVEDVTDAVDEAAQNIKDALKELFGVSDEDIQSVMESLGITNADLLSTNHLADLTVQLTGTQDTVSLLTNSDFQNLIQRLGEVIQTVEGQLQMNMEQISDVYNAVTELLNSDETQNVGTDLLNELLNNQETVTNIAEGSTATVDSTKMETKSEQVTSNGQNEATGENLQNVITDATSETSDNAGEESFSQNGDTNQQALQNADSLPDETDVEDGLTRLKENFEQIFEKNVQSDITAVTTTVGQVSLQQTAQGVETVLTQTTTPSYLSASDIDSILAQITKETVVQITDTTSIMEMQLNPENLGKLTLQVASKEGVISAQITAQNEAVKNAIESQIATLKDNLNAQGLKVEAVEVTVESHEFERNLEQNTTGENQQEQSKQSDSEKQGRRNIQMDQLDDIQGLMTEEESLIAKMMVENGNTMDLTA